MRSIKIVGLTILAALALSAVAVSQAVAAEYIYKVEGKELTGTKEVTSKAKSSFVLKGEEEILGTKVKSETTCEKLKLNESEKPVIGGGKPGKSEKEKVEFSSCKATVGGAKCKEVEIGNAPTKNEVVTVLAPAKDKGDLATLFSPAKEKEAFTKIHFKSCGLLGSPEATVEGTTAALVSSEKTEATVGVLIYSGTEPVSEVEKSNKTTEKVGLKANGLPATISGEAEVELVSKEKYGVF
jgi:hypothetical protein